MRYTIPSYPFSSRLGWSHSRYDLFTTCLRSYYYQYYGAKYGPADERPKIAFLKKLTTQPLEHGNIVHKLMEAVLRRFQRSATPLQAHKLHSFAKDLCVKELENKIFIEHIYGGREIGYDDFAPKLYSLIDSFLQSETYEWIMEEAKRGDGSWIVEPEGFGETRISGQKAYCKMDLLMLRESSVSILDWKTGRRDPLKHKKQMSAYATAVVEQNKDIAIEELEGILVYMNSDWVESETITFSEGDIESCRRSVASEKAEMERFCQDVDANTPLAMSHFTPCQIEAVCSICRYQNLCHNRALLF